MGKDSKLNKIIGLNFCCVRFRVFCLLDLLFYFMFSYVVLYRLLEIIRLNDNIIIFCNIG